jgi:GGDEF domain-containing protein
LDVTAEGLKRPYDADEARVNDYAAPIDATCAGSSAGPVAPIAGAMAAALPGRRLLFGAAAAAYAAVFAAMLAFDRPGLGLSRFFFIALVVAALASGALGGAGAGVVATALYAGAVLVSDRLPDHSLFTFSMVTRVVTYVGVGALIGFFAAQQRALAGHLRLLADRDRLSGLPTSRPFEAELTRRLEEGNAFALLLADVDDLGDRARAGELLLRLPELLSHSLHPTDTVARVGKDEFAVLAACRSSEEAGALAGTLESVFRAGGVDVTFGWATSPAEGRNGLALYRAANERLYARKAILRPRVAS